jgi:hypothetical protein
MGKAVAEFAAKAIEAIGPVMTMIAAMMAKLAESYTMLLEVVSGAAYKDAENATERAQEVMTNQNRFALASRQEGISDKQRYINQRLVSEEAFREKNNGITKGAAYYAAQWDREHPEQAAGAPAMQAPQAGPPAMQGGAEPQVLKEEKVVTTTNKVDIKVSALPGSEVQTSVTGDAENVKVKGGGANLGAANEY